MPDTYYRTGQAAKQLGISSHHIRKLCEAGLIEADVTDGNQWRIPAVEIGRLHERGIPPIPHVERASPTCKEERTEPAPEICLERIPSPEVQEAVDDLLITETHLKKRKLEREREEVEDFFRERERHAAAEAAAMRRRQEQETAESRRREWADSWQVYALRTIPKDAPPDTRIEAHQSVQAVLSHVDPRQPEYVVQQLVDAAVRKVLQPYERRKEIERIVNDAVKTLPSSAIGFSTPTVWEVKVRQAAAAAIAKLDTHATERDIRAVTLASAQAISGEFQDREARQSILSRLQYWMLFEANSDEREEAKEIAQSVLAELPVGTPREKLQKAVDAALLPFEQAVKRRAEAERRERDAESLADANLSRIDSYLCEEFEFDSFSDEREAAWRLREEIRPILIQRLQSNVLSSAQIRGFIERLIDSRI